VGDRRLFHLQLRAQLADGQGLTRGRARIRTREAVDNAPMRRAMSCAVLWESGLLTVEWTGSPVHAWVHAHTYM
jgi:hypothetical protein